MAGNREALIALLKERSVRHGDFVLASGARSPYYIDCRPTTMSALGQRLIGRLGLAAIRDAGWQPRAVGGLTMGADPVAYAIASASLGEGSGEWAMVNGEWEGGSTPESPSPSPFTLHHSPTTIDAFSVRKAPKDHGTNKRIEGNFAAGWPVVVIEDVITSGGSALSAIEAVRAEGGEVIGVLAVLDRQAGGRERIAATGVPAVTLLTARELGLDGDR